MAPFITNSNFRLYPSFSRLYAYLLRLCGRIHKLPNIQLHKLPLNKFNAREFAAPIAFFHPDDMGSGPGTNPASLSSSGAPPRHRIYPTPLNRLSVWAYLALTFVILAMVTVITYMIYTCYHTAGLRARFKPTANTGAGTADVKGGWQNLGDRGGDKNSDGETTMVEGSENEDWDVGGEKIVDYRDKNKKNRMIGPWSERKESGLKGLGIQLQGSPESQYDFASRLNESQVSILLGSPHSTCSNRSIGSASDREHEQALSQSSDCPSLNAQPLAHTTGGSAKYIPFRLPLPMPLPLPLPLPPPVTPSPVQKQVKHKRTRLRALTQILPHNMTQNQHGRDMFFELQPMIAKDSGVAGQSKGLLSETPDDSSSPPSPSPPSSRSRFAFFAPYSSSNSTSSSDSTSKSNSNASWGNNSSCSSTAFPTTPITPLTPITPMSPITSIVKPGGGGSAATVELQFDSNNIQFVETPARIDSPSDALSTSPPEIQGVTLAAASLTRAEMLWNDPKLSPVQGAFGGLTGQSPKPLPLAHAHVPAPTLATPDQVHRGHANSRLGYLRHGVSLSSPPSPSPSPSSSNSSLESPLFSPSTATARFILDRDELKRDNLRNRGARENLKGNNGVKVLSPIPRPVFLPHPKLSSRAENPF